MDMGKDIFAGCSYGQVALKKLTPVPETFRLFSAGWLGDNPKDWDVMKVTGADFRVAKKGLNKGKLSIRVKGSERSAFVSRAEMQAVDAGTKQTQTS